MLAVGCFRGGRSGREDSQRRLPGCTPIQPYAAGASRLWPNLLWLHNTELTNAELKRIEAHGSYKLKLTTQVRYAMADTVETCSRGYAVAPQQHIQESSRE